MDNAINSACDCGTTYGLIAKGDRLWCPECLWKEVERLRAKLRVESEAITRLRGGCPVNPKMVCKRCGWRGRSADRLIAPNPFRLFGRQMIFGCPKCRAIESCEIAPAKTKRRNRWPT